MPILSHGGLDYAYRHSRLMNSGACLAVSYMVLTLVVGESSLTLTPFAWSWCSIMILSTVHAAGWRALQEPSLEVVQWEHHCWQSHVEAKRKHWRARFLKVNMGREVSSSLTEVGDDALLNAIFTSDNFALRHLTWCRGSGKVMHRRISSPDGPDSAPRTSRSDEFKEWAGMLAGGWSTGWTTIEEVSLYVVF